MKNSEEAGNRGGLETCASAASGRAGAYNAQLRRRSTGKLMELMKLISFGSVKFLAPVFGQENGLSFSKLGKTLSTSFLGRG